MQPVVRTKSAYNLWCLSSVSKPRAAGLGQSPASIVDPFTMVRCPSFFPPRMRASWVWQRRSRGDGKDIRPVAHTQWIFLATSQFPFSLHPIVTAMFRWHILTLVAKHPAVWVVVIVRACDCSDVLG